ncbi:MAG: DUF86 domain-containing protein [Bacillota bacterium]|nr:DUF86 domain-containing protein [Bacillota bacterium]
MLNPQLIAERAQDVRTSVARLRKLATLSREEFRAGPDNYAIAEHHLRRGLQALLDMGRHIVVKSGWGNPSRYRDVFRLLEQGGVLDAQFRSKVEGIAGYRNRLVHDYAEITEEEMWQILRTRLDDMTELLSRLTDYASARIREQAETQPN